MTIRRPPPPSFWPRAVLPRGGQARRWKGKRRGGSQILKALKWIDCFRKGGILKSATHHPESSRHPLQWRASLVTNQGRISPRDDVFYVGSRGREKMCELVDDGMKNTIQAKWWGEWVTEWVNDGRRTKKTQKGKEGPPFFALSSLCHSEHYHLLIVVLLDGCCERGGLDDDGNKEHTHHLPHLLWISVVNHSEHFLLLHLNEYKCLSSFRSDSRSLLEARVDLSSTQTKDIQSHIILFRVTLSTLWVGGSPSVGVVVIKWLHIPHRHSYHDSCYPIRFYLSSSGRSFNDSIDSDRWIPMCAGDWMQQNAFRRLSEKLGHKPQEQIQIETRHSVNHSHTCSGQCQTYDRTHPPTAGHWGICSRKFTPLYGNLCT